MQRCLGWVQGAAWDGRWALAVCSDAGQPAGAAQGMSGAAAVAVLVGGSAPVVLDEAWPSWAAADHMIVCGRPRAFYSPGAVWATPQVERNFERRTAAPLALTALTGPLRSAAACAGLCSLLLSGGRKGRVLIEVSGEAGSAALQLLAGAGARAWRMCVR